MAGPGSQFGPYEIIELIGEGGMGRVYKARDTRLQRFVALKVPNEDFSQRFIRETKAISKLNHPRICSLFDVGPGYLVMEYIQGRPLRGPVPWHSAIDYATQILDALDAAHQQGIIHRDLKPANILVTSSGVKLLDFGLAKVAETALSPSEETQTQPFTTGEKTIVGTPAYMAPEQIDGKAVDSRTDVFAFGCVLYELLT